LTELFVRRAKLAAGSYYDAKERGLLLLVQESGHRSFYFMYNVCGRTRWYNIGWIGLSDARRRAAKLRAEVADDKDPQAERKAERDAGTFAELHQRYVTEWARKRNKSWEQPDRLVRKHLLPRWGRLNAKGITRADVHAALAKIDKPSVMNQTLAAASAVFTFAVKMEVVAFNPCRGIDSNPTKARERVLSDSEIASFWPHLTPALRVILLTGQRPGEVSHMRREHVKDGWWEMPGEPDLKTQWPGTKNGESHRVWLSEPVREVISVQDRGHLTGQDHGQLSTGLVFKRDRAPRAMRGICAKLGVDNKVTPHDLRRTFGTFVTRMKFGRAAMDRILNHRDRSVGTVYDQYSYATEDQHIMETVARHIVDLAEGRRGTGTVIRGPFFNEAS
jgi:integrase